MRIMLPTPDRILRTKDVTEATGLSRWTILRLEKVGEFPRRMPLMPQGRLVGWLHSEICDWIAMRAEQRGR